MRGQTLAWCVLVVATLCTVLFMATGLGICSAVSIFYAVASATYLIVKHERKHRRTEAAKTLLLNAPAPDHAPPLSSPGNHVIKLPTPRYG